MVEIAEFEFNSAPEVRKELNFAPDVFIVDSTIRSLQSGVSGSYHTAQDLIDIGKALDELGVRELIINLSWKDGLTVCEGLAAIGLRAKIVGTFRARHELAPEWTQQGIAAGCEEICFESALDGEHLKTLAHPVFNADKSVSHAFAEVYGYQEVVDLCRAGVAISAQSLSFHDSYFRFALTPEAAKAFYHSVRKDVPQCPPLYVHLSNFYGNATMTAAAAITAGASAADVCMNGIGHHCGHISLVEITMVLEALYRVKTGIRLEKLTEVSRLVRERSGIDLPLPSPVVGDFAFMTDGAYWAAEANVPFEQRVHSTFPHPPGLVGNDELVVWAAGTITTASVRAKLAMIRISEREQRDEVVAEIVWELNSVLRQRGRYPSWIPDHEFEQVCRDVIQAHRAKRQ